MSRSDGRLPQESKVLPYQLMNESNFLVVVNVGPEQALRITHNDKIPREIQPEARRLAGGPVARASARAARGARKPAPYRPSMRQAPSASNPASSIQAQAGKSGVRRISRTS